MSDDSKRLLKTDDLDVEGSAVERWATRSSWPAYTFWNTLIFCMSAVFFFKAIYVSPDDVTCTRQLSTYSPALTAVEYYSHEFANGFNEQDEYRGAPTPEKDAAWLALWSMGDIVVPDPKLARLNKTDEATKKISRPELGGVAANLEVFHQLHCLDLIRRYTYLDAYSPTELPADFQDVDADYIRTHIDHCISTLRQAIMCTSDVTPVLLERSVDDPLDVRGDFHTLHKCRNFKKLQAWFIGESYTDWDCIQKGGIGCDVIPEKYKRPV